MFTKSLVLIIPYIIFNSLSVCFANQSQTPNFPSEIIGEFINKKHSPFFLEKVKSKLMMVRDRLKIKKLRTIPVVTSISIPPVSKQEEDPWLRYYSLESNVIEKVLISIIESIRRAVRCLTIFLRTTGDTLAGMSSTVVKSLGR